MGRWFEITMEFLKEGVCQSPGFTYIEYNLTEGKAKASALLEGRSGVWSGHKACF